MDADLGRRLRDLRKQRGLTQKDVAIEMALRGHDAWIQTTTAKVESAQRPLRFAEYVAVCEVLGVDPAELLAEMCGTGDEAVAESMAEVRRRRLEVMRAKASVTSLREDLKRAEQDLQRARFLLHQATVRRVSLAKGVVSDG